MSEVYKSACEGVHELSGRPLNITSQALIALFVPRSKTEGNAFRSEARDV